MRECDDALGLSDLASAALCDSRPGKNTVHRLDGLFRQSVYGRLIAIDGKALRGARDKGQSVRTRMMVSAYAARLRLTLATVAADPGGELEAALEVLCLIALKGTVRFLGGSSLR